MASKKLSRLLTCSSCALLLLALLMLASPSPTSGSPLMMGSSGKRFDCQGFCKLTGYHGMIGGCRCSFTLFTAKRSPPSEPFWQQQDASSSVLPAVHPTNLEQIKSHYPSPSTNGALTKSQLDKSSKRLINHPEPDLLRHPIIMR